MPSPRLLNKWIDDPITALVAQRVTAVAAQRRGDMSRDELKERLDEEVGSYRAELEALPKELLAQRVAEGRQLESDIAAKQQAYVERQRFFHQPDAAMDVIHWSKMSFWSIDEALALSFGKDPRIVTWTKVRAEHPGSPFAKMFADRREILTRAKAAGQLFDSTIPGVFLAWAQRMQVSVPDQLIEAVLALGVQIRDWKTAYDEQQSNLAEVSAQLQDTRAARLQEMAAHKKYIDELAANYKTIIDGRVEINKADQTMIQSLKDRIAELEAMPVAPSAPGDQTEKSLGTRERESLLKILIGMAVKGYGYDPKAGRNGSAREIAGDLAQLGISLDEDTIRKYLTEAKALLPPTETK